MKLFVIFSLLIIIGRHCIRAHNIICYYDAASESRKGFGQFTMDDLENALEICTHLIYGYAGINAQSLQMVSLKPERDIENRHFEGITDLKIKYPHIKFLLSLGGDKDHEDKSNKYLKLLEAGDETQKGFIESVLYLLRSYKFDGLDLAYQFPRIDYNAKEEAWKSLRKSKSFGNLSETNKTIESHKEQFVELVCNLRKALQRHELLLGLTVLPNINASQFFNVSALINNLDFVNLQTFDFTTPELSPSTATYTAPLYPISVQGHGIRQHSVDYQVNYWIAKRVPHNKLNVGIAAYGRAWKMTSGSNRNGYPKVMATEGPATASYVTKLPGILTWMEICSLLPNILNANNTGPHAPLQSVLDPHRDFATYAFRPADANGDYGVWVSYDDPRIAANKAAYVKRRHLGGIALYDVSLDDYHGVCNGDKFPMLRYIKYKFL